MTGIVLQSACELEQLTNDNEQLATNNEELDTGETEELWRCRIAD